MASPKHTRYSDFTPHRVKQLWQGFAATLLITLIAGLFTESHPHFGIDGTPFFYAWFGFLACAAIVLFSKFLGLFLKRPDTYYHGKDAS